MMMLMMMRCWIRYHIRWCLEKNFPASLVSVSFLKQPRVHKISAGSWKNIFGAFSLFSEFLQKKYCLHLVAILQYLHFSSREYYLVCRFVLVNSCVVLHDMSWYKKINVKKLPRPYFCLLKSKAQKISRPNGCYLAAVLIGRDTNLARPPVCPSVL